MKLPPCPTSSAYYSKFKKQSLAVWFFEVGEHIDKWMEHSHRHSMPIFDFFKSIPQKEEMQVQATSSSTSVITSSISNIKAKDVKIK